MRTKVPVFLLFLFSSLILTAQSTEFPAEEKLLEWAPVEGARYYLVEIETGGVILYSIRTEEPSLPLFLNPGSYNIRISVFNKFEKMASRSDWSPLQVYPNPQPIIDAASPYLFYSDEESITLEIEGRDFDEGCRFYLVKGQERIRGSEVSRAPLGEGLMVEVVFQGERLNEIGLWDLVVINPSNKDYVKEKAVKISERRLPAIESISPSVIHRGDSPGKFLIKGENFSSRARLIIDGPSPAGYENLETFYGEEITFYFDPSELALGIYRISVENEGGVISNEVNLSLEERIISQEEQIRVKRETSPLFFGFAYHLSAPMDRESDRLFNTSFLGFTLNGRRKFQNSGIYTLPILRQSGYAAGIHYTQYSDAIADYLTLTQVVFDGSFFYLSDWGTPVNLFLSLGFGSAYSLYFFNKGRVVNSLDFTNRIEAALQYSRKKMTYELGYSIDWTHFKSHSMTAFSPYLLLGWNG